MNQIHLKTRDPKNSPLMVEGDGTFYGRVHFHHLLRIERQRTERSKRPFLLILLDISAVMQGKRSAEILGKINAALLSALRETDIRGWYEQDDVVGVILPEIASLDETSIEGIFRKIHLRMSAELPMELIKKIVVSFHFYPESREKKTVNIPFNLKLYPDLAEPEMGYRFSQMLKRIIDVVGSAVALMLFSPVFWGAALAIKLTSRGPVFFKQERLGLNGDPFMLFKFRSMYLDSDQRKHQEYIQKYICEQERAAVEPGVFKLNNDPRITPAGRWLRKTSLDELPQLINVLRGEMSLVGPRPPIFYECELYDIWHLRRLLMCKPGITGLWQVMGRSRTTFDGMVRLDLQYINHWSLWLDLKILLKTPGAVFGGQGAY